MGKWRAAHPRKVSVVIDCASCGVAFETPAWRLAQGKGKFCSRACYELGRRVPQGVEYDGLWFARTGKNRYYWHKRSNKTSVSLHRYVWQKHRGHIPPGHAIHHIDGDPANNALENLECLPRGDHQRAHVLKRVRISGRFTKQLRASM